MMRRLRLLALTVALITAGCANESTESAILSAKAALAKNETSAAGIALRNALANTPDSAEARFLFGKTLLLQGDPVGAAVELRKALNLQHPEVEVLPVLARAMLAQQLHTELTAEFGTRVLPDATAMADLRTSVAKAYAAEAMLPQANEALQSALLAQPDYAPAQIFEVVLLAGTAEFERALALMAKVLEQHPQDSQAWRVQADLLRYLKRDFAGALEAYRKAIGFDKFNIEAHAGALSILASRNEPDAFDKQLEELRKVALNHPQTLFFDAQLAFQRANYAQVIALLQNVLRLAPDDPRALQLAGAAELQTGALAQAETHLLKALQLAGNQPMTRQLLARTYLQSGQPGKAVAILGPALENRPNALTLSLAAEAHLRNGDAKEAEALFARAAKLDPADARSGTALAFAAMSRGKDLEGFAQLQALAAGEKANAADMALIATYLARHRLDDALAAIDRLEAKVPNKAAIADLRGRAYLLSGKRADARKSFERALSIDPAFFPAVTSLAALDMADKKPEEARKRVEAALTANPKSVPALLAMVELKTLAGAPAEEVTALLVRAVQASPNDVVPRVQLVEHYLRTQRPREAMTAAQEGAAAIRDAPELLDVLGRAQMAAGDANQAIATFGKVINLRPKWALTHMRLAEAYLAAKNPEAARQSLKQAWPLRRECWRRRSGWSAWNCKATGRWTRWSSCAQCGNSVRRRPRPLRSKATSRHGAATTPPPWPLTPAR